MTGGDSLIAERDLFQSQYGGAIPTSPLQCRIRGCEFKDIAFIFRKYHYKGDHIGGGISYCIALRYGMKVVGGCVIGKLRQEQAYKNNNKVLELRRMACLDECPKNTESYFLSKIIWFLKKHTDIDEVISYSDMSVGHIGTIYKAANFKLLGETAPTKHIFWKGVRYHPRSLNIERPYSYKLREAVKSGEAVEEMGKPKLIFSYKITKGEK